MNKTAISHKSNKPSLNERMKQFKINTANYSIFTNLVYKNKIIIKTATNMNVQITQQRNDIEQTNPAETSS